MNIKSQKILSVSFIVIGLIIGLIFAAYGEEDYNGGILCGMGTALTFVGIFRLVKLYRISRDPEKAADYEAANKDERVIYIANKARSLTFAISIYVQLAVGLIAQFVFGQRLLSMVMCYFVCFQCLLFVLLYRIYSKKY